MSENTFNYMKTRVSVGCVNTSRLIAGGQEHLLAEAQVFVALGRSDPWVEVRLLYPTTEIDTTSIQFALPDLDRVTMRLDGRSPSAYFDLSPTERLCLTGDSPADCAKLMQWIQSVAFHLTQTIPSGG
jgi:hypothetical protein